MWTFKSAMAFWAVLAALPLATSVAYFVASPRSISLARRAAASAHGLFIALIHLGVVGMVLVNAYDYKYSPPLGVLCAVAAGMIAYSFWAFRGHKAIHLLQGINIIWLLGLMSLGGMAVTGRWL